MLASISSIANRKVRSTKFNDTEQKIVSTSLLNVSQEMLLQPSAFNGAQFETALVSSSDLYEESSEEVKTRLNTVAQGVMAAKASVSTQGDKVVFKTEAFQVQGMKSQVGGVKLVEGVLRNEVNELVFVINRYPKNSTSPIQAVNEVPQGSALLTDVFSLDYFSSSFPVVRKKIKNLEEGNEIRFSLSSQEDLNQVCPWKHSNGQCISQGLQCKWYDVEKKFWNSSGCSLKMTSTGAQCVCQHLTDFAVFANYGHGFRFFGNPIFIVFAGIFLIEAVWCFSLFGRMYRVFRNKFFLLTYEYALLGAFTSSRSLIFFLVYFGESCDNMARDSNSLCFSEVGLGVALSLPYWFLFWIFDFMLLAWIIIAHTATTPTGEPPFPKKKFMFFNFVIALLMLGLFVGQGLASNKDKTKVGLAGMSVISSILLVLAAGFIVYGLKMSKALTSDFPSKHARKILRNAIINCVCLVVMGLFNIFAAAAPGAFVSSFDIIQSAYLCVEVISTCAVMWMFHDPARRTLHEYAKTSKSKAHKHKFRAVHSHGSTRSIKSSRREQRESRARSRKSGAKDVPIPENDLHSVCVPTQNTSSWQETPASQVDADIPGTVVSLPPVQPLPAPPPPPSAAPVNQDQDVGIKEAGTDEKVEQEEDRFAAKFGWYNFYKTSDFQDEENNATGGENSNQSEELAKLQQMLSVERQLREAAEKRANEEMQLRKAAEERAAEEMKQCKAAEDRAVAAEEAFAKLQQ